MASEGIKHQQRSGDGLMLDAPMKPNDFAFELQKITGARLLEFLQTPKELFWSKRKIAIALKAVNGEWIESKVTDNAVSMRFRARYSWRNSLLIDFEIEGKITEIMFSLEDRSDSAKGNATKLASALCMAFSENLTAMHNDKLMKGKVQEVLENFREIASFCVGFAAMYFEPQIKEAEL